MLIVIFLSKKTLKIRILHLFSLLPPIGHIGLSQIEVLRHYGKKQKERKSGIGEGRSTHASLHRDRKSKKVACPIIPASRLKPECLDLDRNRFLFWRRKNFHFEELMMPDVQSNRGEKKRKNEGKKYP